MNLSLKYIDWLIDWLIAASKVYVVFLSKLVLDKLVVYSCFCSNVFCSSIKAFSLLFSLTFTFTHIIYDVFIWFITLCLSYFLSFILFFFLKYFISNLIVITWTPRVRQKARYNTAKFDQITFIYFQNNKILSSQLANLAKWLSVCLRAKKLWVPVPFQWLKLQIWLLFRASSSLTFRKI